MLLGRELLSEFQQKKFRHFFYHVLDLNSDHVISEEDFTGLNYRVRHYMEWSLNTAQYLILTEVHDLFIKYFLQTSAKFIKVKFLKLSKIWENLINISHLDCDYILLSMKDRITLGRHQTIDNIKLTASFITSLNSRKKIKALTSARETPPPRNVRASAWKSGERTWDTELFCIVLYCIFTF